MLVRRVINMGEGSEAARLPLLGSYELTAGKDWRLNSAERLL